MRIVYLLIGLTLWGECGTAFATSPEIVMLQTMIESDMSGDPSVRHSMATPDAVVVVPSSRQIDRADVVYDLGADAIEIAKSWQFDTSSAKCSPTACQFHVVYRVIGTTVGSGVPSWNRNRGREIRLLPTVIDRRVQYNLIKIDGAWRLKMLPPPYVSPKILEAFFKREMERAALSTPALGADARAVKNREVVEVWRQRQLDILKSVSP